MSIRSAARLLVPLSASLGLLACGPASNTTQTAPTPVPTVSGDDLGTTYALGSDEEELALLRTFLASDGTLDDLAGPTPLVNDGGAVFMDVSASAYRVLGLSSGAVRSSSSGQEGSLGLQAAPGRRPDRDFEAVPRLKVFPMARKAVREEISIGCGSGEGDPGTVRRSSICLDRESRTATLVSQERVDGKVAVDLPPYRDSLDDISEDASGSGVGLSARRGRVETRLQLVRRRTGWEILSVAPTRYVSDDLPESAPRISWVDGVMPDQRRLPGFDRHDKLTRRGALPGIPPSSQLVLRVRMSSIAPTLVMVGGLGRPLRLVDDGTRGDEFAGDGLYSARIPTPPHPRAALPLVVTAVPASALSSEATAALPEETWIVPFEVR